jgi:UDP-N-acetylmuramoyl-L-alanyl-D-glutamate--2,6-diaminopimelate ligase
VSSRGTAYALSATPPDARGNAASAGATLADLVAAHGEGAIPWGAPTTRVREVTCDSRAAKVGGLFVAVPGEKADGADYVGEAFARGAAAAVVARDRATGIAPVAGRALVACTAPRAFLADAAAFLAGRPSERLTVVAVTGTSGKTTTTYLIESILAAAGHVPGVIGTIDYRFAGRREPAPLTTPDAVAMQKLLARMLAGGATHVALEASSHALALDRLRATAIDAAVFTNFSRDHLDYHASMEEYLEAKARLFRELLPASGKASFAVLNADDDTVMSVGRGLSARIVTFGVRGDVRAEDVRSDLQGTRGTLALGGDRLAFETRLVGAPHLANVLAAAATTWRLGVPPDAIVRGIAACAAIPGRLEAVRAGQPFQVVVDYAHKPDALERVLSSLRELAPGRIVTVFGCGGDRDAGKRPIMGAIAARLSDVSILTSDNPRTEDPMAILAAIEDGVRSESCTRVAREALGQTGGEAVYVVVPERRAAIRCAIEIARDGDLVLIAGKGHEDYQIVGTVKHHLDDREEALAALASRGFADGGK